MRRRSAVSSGMIWHDLAWLRTDPKRMYVFDPKKPTTDAEEVVRRHYQRVDDTYRESRSSKYRDPNPALDQGLWMLSRQALDKHKMPVRSKTPGVAPKVSTARMGSVTDQVERGLSGDGKIGNVSGEELFALLHPKRRRR